ncbi:hypothetical protein MHYP_G00255300 [Metynnis hypsauchen]
MKDKWGKINHKSAAGTFNFFSRCRDRQQKTTTVTEVQTTADIQTILDTFASVDLSMLCAGYMDYMQHLDTATSEVLIRSHPHHLLRLHLHLLSLIQWLSLIRAQLPLATALLRQLNILSLLRLGRCLLYNHSE